MQSPEKKGKQPSATGGGQSQDTGLSETWRKLLGSQPAGEAGADPVEPVQPLVGDPWNDLQRARGMQPVDLQKIRLHDLHATMNNDDVEHALDVMQEAADSQPDSRKKEKKGGVS